MSFTPAALRFFKDLKRHNNKPWFEAHKEEYLALVVAPMRALIEELDVRFARSAPEITGDPKRSMFRIYRDVRFSKNGSLGATAGRELSDREITNKAIGALLEKEFVRLLPLVRWLNGALGLKPATHR